MKHLKSILFLFLLMAQVPAKAWGYRNGGNYIEMCVPKETYYASICQDKAEYVCKAYSSYCLWIRGRSSEKACYARGGDVHYENICKNHSEHACNALSFCEWTY